MLVISAKKGSLADIALWCIYLFTVSCSGSGLNRVISLREHSNSNSNNNKDDDICRADIMTEVIARVHWVHLVNVEQRQAAADPQTKPHDLGCESACFRQLSCTTTIAIYYYYSVRKLILIYSLTEGRRLS